MENITAIHNSLTKQLEKYTKLIIQEYHSYIPKETLQKIKSIEDFSSIIKIEDYGNINAYATSTNIFIPLSATVVFKTLKKYPGYGINKKHKTINKNKDIVNNNTFTTYIYHVFVSGTTLEGYYEDLLLHETMHFCGGDGASVLKEGLNELLTRILAKKYNLRTNYCGYPKEVKLCAKLMERYGKETIYQLAFMKDFSLELNFIEEKHGHELAELYFKITRLTNDEFFEKYYNHMKSFNGIKGVFLKAKLYSKLKYKAAYKVLEEYINKQAKTHTK